MVPGVIYSALEKRAYIPGTGLEVWEIEIVYRGLNQDFARLQRSFAWLTIEQLQAALTFSEMNPEFVAVELAEADAAPQRLQELWSTYPFTRPPDAR